MNNNISNPLLKQLISEIANKANEGRITNVSWKTINEGKKKKIVKEADEADKDKKEDLPELPPLGGQDEKPKAEPASGKGEKPTGAPAADKAPAAEKKPEPTPEQPDSSEEDAEKAKADAVKAKAELEKAKAEKDQAEKEIKKHSYVKLGSGAGTQFLLTKILDHAFKTNTIDSLASEMVQKLKIQTPEDMTAFSEDTAQYRVLPGMPELLSSMKTMATKQPEQSSEETPEA